MLHRFVFLPLLVLTLLVGCGQRIPGRPSGMPDTTPCRLTVTFGDEIVDGVAVLLTPKNKSQRWYAGGMTDKDGKVTMKTAGHFDGVVPGEYTVSFQKTGRVELDDNEMPIRSHSVIPAKYTAGQSGETITVTTTQTEYPFVLDGLPPPEK